MEGQSEKIKKNVKEDIKDYYEHNYSKVQDEYNKLFDSVDVLMKKKYLQGYRSVYKDAINLLLELPKDKNTIYLNEKEQLYFNSKFEDIENSNTYF